MPPREAVVEPKNPVLERFERAVDLPMYLGYRGFRLVDEQDPSRVAMADPRTGDVFDVRKDLESGAWSFSSRRDKLDRGTLTDFLVARDGLGPAACLERMVALANPLVRDPEGHRYRQFEHGQAPEIRRAIDSHVGALQAEKTALERLERLGVGRGTLDEWRFGKVRSDDDLAKVVSDPVDLWASKYRASDRKLVLVERPIDAMAYEKSRGSQTCCYLAVGGNLSDTQKKKLGHLLCEVPCDKVVLAFGRDEVGRRLAQEVQALAPSLRMERESPAFGARWSDQMLMEQRHARSMKRSVPALGV
jgi:hypothetical protein